MRQAPGVDDMAREDEDRESSKRRDERDHEVGIELHPMPTRLIGAIIASFAWGLLLLQSTCVRSMHLTMGVIQFLRDIRGPEAVFGGRNMLFALTFLQFMLVLLAGVLVAGAIALLMRKGFGKYLAMGAPAGIVLIEMAGLVICLILSDGHFMAAHNVDFAFVMIFSTVVAGLNAFLLIHPDATRALN